MYNLHIYIYVYIYIHFVPRNWHSHSHDSTEPTKDEVGLAATAAWYGSGWAQEFDIVYMVIQWDLMMDDIQCMTV